MYNLSPLAIPQMTGKRKLTGFHPRNTLLRLDAYEAFGLQFLASSIDPFGRLHQVPRTLFESAGFVCNEADNGAKAIEHISVFQPDLIVLNLAMPIMNGLQAVLNCDACFVQFQSSCSRCTQEAYWKKRHVRLGSHPSYRRTKQHPSW
jgi:hypothetical protein